MKSLSLCAAALVVASSASAAVIKVPQNHATITLAIGAAAAGDTILVKAGVYEENLVVGAALIGLKIKGLGKVIVDARPLGAVGSGPGVDIQAVNVTLENMTIRHSKGGLDSSGVLSSANGTVLNKVRVEHADGAGVSITGADAFLTKVEVVDSDGGIQIDGNNAEVTKSLVHRDASIGIQITGDDATITKNAVRATEDQGVFVTGANAVIQSNDIRRTAGGGIVVDGSGATITKNVIDAIVGEGLLVSNATAGTITKNTITDTLDSCLRTATNASGLTISKNDIRRCGLSDNPAVAIEGDGNSLSNDLVRQSAGDGIVISGNNNTLFKVTSSEHGEDGIQFTGTGNSANKCFARKNQGEGMQCDGATNSLTNSLAKLNRIDIAASVPFAPFTNIVFTTGGNADAPEIDD